MESPLLSMPDPESRSCGHRRDCVGCVPVSELEHPDPAGEEDLFAAVLETPAGPEREAFLDQLRAESPDLGQRVADLVETAEKDDGFLSTRESQWQQIVNHAVREASETPGAAPLLMKPGTRVGPFRLIAPLGTGGFGVVYHATQERPVARVAAVKLLRPGLDTLDILRRFDRERETLSRLRHPGIAAFYDAGSTDEDRPWIAMELVDGLPIHRYCDEHRLSIPERLRLFQKACRAVHHAHLRGIIHRDLKPSNLLVTDSDDGPQPKVIDFGVARSLSAEDETGSLVTRVGQVIGTPAYMSPEQAGSGTRDIDTRSDVYALGAVLYEILTSELPLGDSTRSTPLSATALEKLIQEREPGRPSQRITTSLQAENRATPTPMAAASQLRGDLDWITLKALAKDPDRRYESAAALADDIQAHLDQRPVIARPPSFAYLAGRFARRHRAAAAAGLVMLLSILGALTVSTVMYFREAEARRLAEIETRRSAQISRFLEDTLSAAGPEVALGRDTTLMREILEKAATRLAETTTPDPVVESQLRSIIGRTWGELLEFQRSTEELQIALDLTRALHPGDHPDLATSLFDYASALEQAGRVREAEPLIREGLAMRERLHGPDHPLTGEALSLLAYTLVKSGRSAEGEPHARRSLDIWRQHPELEPLWESPKTLATIYKNTGRLDEAVALFQEELDTFRALLGHTHPIIANCLDNYGYTLAQAGRDTEAEPILLEGLAMGRQYFGDRSPHEDHILGALARIAGRRGDLAQQLAYARQGATTGARVYPEGHRYWRESQRQYLDTLLGQIQHYLEQSWDQESALEPASHRLAEIRENPSLEKVFQPGDAAWVTWLAAAIEARRAGDETPAWRAADTTLRDQPPAKAHHTRLKTADLFREKLRPPPTRLP